MCHSLEFPEAKDLLAHFHNILSRSFSMTLLKRLARKCYSVSVHLIPHVLAGGGLSTKINMEKLAGFIQSSCEGEKLSVELSRNARKSARVEQLRKSVKNLLRRRKITRIAARWWENSYSSIGDKECIIYMSETLVIPSALTKTMTQSGVWFHAESAWLTFGGRISIEM